MVHLLGHRFRNVVSSVKVCHRDGNLMPLFAGNHRPVARSRGYSKASASFFGKVPGVDRLTFSKYFLNFSGSSPLTALCCSGRLFDGAG
jgi:hypothetical protein